MWVQREAYSSYFMLSAISNRTLTLDSTSLLTSCPPEIKYTCVLSKMSSFPNEKSFVFHETTWNNMSQCVQTLPWVAADHKMGLRKWSSWASIMTLREELQQRKFPVCCTEASTLLCDRNVIVLAPLLILLAWFESLYNGAGIIAEWTLGSSANTENILSLR